MSQSVDPGSQWADADARTGQRYRSGGGPSSPPAAGQEGVAPLISGLIKDLQDLVRGEIQLAKTELKENATSAGKGIAFIAGGALVGVVGFIFLMLGVTYLLNIWMRMWIAATVVGLSLMLIAGIFAMSGKSKLSGDNLTPDQTIDSLKEDQAWAKQQINSVKK